MKKMIKVYVALAAIATLAFGLFSCSGGGNDVNPLALYSPLTPLNSPTLKYLDLSNAKSLYISGGSGTSANKADGISASASGPDHKKIFKITDDGYVEEVKYLDADKKEISIWNEPCVIEKINDDYIFVGFGYGGFSPNVGWDTVSSYIIRKLDGAAFDMKNTGTATIHDENSETWKNASNFHTDKNNNMYYISCDQNFFHKIVRVDLSGIASLAGTTVSPSTDDIYCFDVDKDGNIIYYGYSVLVSNNKFKRIRKSNGGIKNISVRNDYWIGLDGCIYYNTNEGQVKVSIDAEGNLSESSYGTNTDLFFFPHSSYKLDLKNRIIIVYDGYINEVYNPSANPRRVSLAGISLEKIFAANSTENFYYIAGADNSGNTILIKVSLAKNFDVKL